MLCTYTSNSISYPSFIQQMKPSEQDPQPGFPGFVPSPCVAPRSQLISQVSGSPNALHSPTFCDTPERLQLCQRGFTKLLKQILNVILFVFKERVLYKTLRRIKGISFKQNKINENVFHLFLIFPEFKLNVKGCSSICWTSNTVIINNG